MHGLYPAVLYPHRRGGIRQWLCTSLRTGRVRVVAFLLAWRFGSRSCFAPLRKFYQSISYVRPRYSRVAVDARVAGYLCVAGYPCLSLMAQVLLFLDVAAQVAFLHASKNPPVPDAVEPSSRLPDGGILPEFGILAHVSPRFGGGG